MGQRTLKASEVEKLIEVVKAMKDGDFLGVKKVGGTRPPIYDPRPPSEAY